jgi:outer membrane biosynthesis protein TonB
MTRTALIALLLALSFGPLGSIHAARPVKPKVLSTPTPAPAPAPAKPVKAAPSKPAPPVPTPAPAPADAPAADAPKPVRKKPPQKSVATLVAEYTKSVKAVLGTRWQEAATERASDFTSGSLSIAFQVDAGGKVVDFAVKSNSSNEALATFCEKLVRETNFEKPPARALTDGKLEIPFNFTIL